MRLHFLAGLLASLAASVPVYASPVDRQRAEGHQIPFQLDLQASPESKEPNLVPVTLGVMSRCPDAHACEQTMDRVFATRSPQGLVRTLVAPDLLFIGHLNDTAAPYGVECKHGPSECRGNVQQLCAMDQYDWKVWWPFVQCLRWSGSRIGDDSLARECADLSHFDWTPVQRCVDGPRGAELLQESVARAAEQHVATSCSVLINDRLVCMRDDGVWKDCQQGHEVSDFAAQIARAYQTLN